MTASAAFKVIEKYVLPRNPAVRELELIEVMSAEPVGDTGKLEGDHMPLYRGNNPALPNSDMLSPGTLYGTKLGWAYVPDARLSDAEWLFEGAKTAARLTVPFIGELTGPLSDIASDVMFDTIDGVPTSPAKGSLKGSARDVCAELEKRGTLCLPGTNLVEIEHQVDPAGFLRKESHRCIMTYEQQDGHRATYTLRFRGPKAHMTVTYVMYCSVSARVAGEFRQLVPSVKAEQFDATTLWNSKLQEFTARYGDKLGEHWSELVQDYSAAADAELAKKGFTDQIAAQVALSRLAPLIPAYEKVPYLDKAVVDLRALADGKTPSAN